MKYLIFNFSVFLALGYLIMGDKVPTDLSNSFEKAGASIQEIVREKPKDNSAPKRPPEIKRVVEAPVPVEPVKEKIETVAAQPDPIFEAVPEIPEPIEVKKVVAQQAPPPRVETQEPEPLPVQEVQVAEVDIETVEEATPEDRLMDARARSAALREMAAEMEQMFAEKMTW